MSNVHFSDSVSVAVGVPRKYGASYSASTSISGQAIGAIYSSLDAAGKTTNTIEEKIEPDCQPNRRFRSQLVRNIR